MSLCLIRHHVMQIDQTYDIVTSRPAAKQQLCKQATVQ
jgi:hypothetical protein